MNRRRLGSFAALAYVLGLAGGCGGDDHAAGSRVAEAGVLPTSGAVHDASALAEAGVSLAPPATDGGLDAAASLATGDAATASLVDSGTLPLDDAQIAGILSAANVAEINLGMLAATVARDGAIIAYANTVVTASIDAQDSEGTLLQTLGLTPEESDVTAMLAADTQQAADALNAAPAGPGFDHAYIANEVKMQQSLIDLIDRALLVQVQNAELTAFIQQTRATVLMHLQSAKQLLSTYRVADDGGVSGGPADAGL